MTFHTPPRNQGQIVEVSYAMTPAGIVRRTYDKSDRLALYALAPWTAKLEKWSESSGPWNTNPPAAKYRIISERDVERLAND